MRIPVNEAQILPTVKASSDSPLFEVIETTFPARMYLSGMDATGGERKAVPERVTARLQSRVARLLRLGHCYNARVGWE